MRLILIIIMFLLTDAARAGNIVIQNRHLLYTIDETGRNISFIDKRTGIDYLAAAPSYCASIIRQGKTYQVKAVKRINQLLRLDFTDGASALIEIRQQNDWISFEVKKVSGDIETLHFLDIPLKLEGMPFEPFGACVLAMNLHTRVDQLPALQTWLKASSHRRFGLTGAAVSLVGVPAAAILPTIQAVMQTAKELPHSEAGGAWAQQAKEGYGSYLMNFGTLADSNLDQWIALCRQMHFTQIDNHGGDDFFTFGDLTLNPAHWPGGWNDYKRINDKLHAAGISSILHTYAFFIDKNSKYVTPKPSHDLGYFRKLTLAKPISPTDTTIAVNEPTDSISLITGFFVRNSLTIRIGDELVEFTGVSKTKTYRLTGCKRGALGTTAVSHATGEKAFHLRQMFGRFVPGPETPLFSEIARHTAEIVDLAGFDGIYLDAIDGSDILAGVDNFWYYGSKFIVEVFKNLRRPVGMEMSSMSHLWWHYRSRWQAWDRPVRGYKKFIDIHCASIKSEEHDHGLWRGSSADIAHLAPAENGGLLLPLQLGWWEHQTWNPPQIEATFSDDIDYLGCKMIGNNAGLAFTGGFDDSTLKENPAFVRLNNLISQYEALRQQNYFSDSIRALFRQPGMEYKLFREPGPAGRYNLRHMRYQKQKTDSAASSWTIENNFAPQPLQLRIESLMSVKQNDDSTISDPTKTLSIENAAGVTASVKPAKEQTPTKTPAITFSAVSTGASPRTASWAKAETRFQPALDLSQRQALGVWIKGDGKGELLNLRLESPKAISNGARGDHFIKIDFTGWKYFQLVEIGSEEFTNYTWPAPHTTADFYVYDSYRHTIAFDQIDKLQYWYNNLPPNDSVTTVIGPVKALPLIDGELTNPSISIDGKKLTFLTTIRSGMYLEFYGKDDCRLYGPKGEFIRNVQIEGTIPTLQTGTNTVTLETDAAAGPSPRAQLTIIENGNSLIHTSN